MRVRVVHRKALFAGASVVLLLLCVLLLRAMKTDSVRGTDSPRGEAVDPTKPGPSAVCLDHVRRIARGMDQGAQISLVRFVSSRREAWQDDAQGEATIKVFPIATYLSGTFGPGAQQIWIGGTFTLIADLNHPFFSNWGLVKDSVNVDARRRDKNYRRLAALLPYGRGTEPRSPTARLPVDPVTVLAVMPRSARTAVDGNFIGPLTEGDVDNLPGLVQLLTKEAVGKMTTRRAEELLGSSNPWVAWLGLARLSELKALRTEHFNRAIRCRVPEDAKAVVLEIEGVGFMNQTMRVDLSQQLVGLGATPAMQEATLRAVVEWVQGRRESPGGSTHPIDFPAMKQAARDHRKKVKDDPAYRGVVRQLDALISLP